MNSTHSERRVSKAGRRTAHAWMIAAAAAALALTACSADAGPATEESSGTEVPTNTEASGSTEAPTSTVGPVTPAASAATLDDRPLEEQLFDAVRGPDQALATLAIEAGADVDDASASGASPLQIAIVRNDVPMALLLLDAGASVEFPDEGYSLLQVAASDAEPEMVQALVDAGAAPDGVATNLGGPLMTAAYAGRVDNLTVLLEAGADPNHVHDNGAEEVAPLYGAAVEGHTDAAALLLEWGADATWTAANGQTLAEVARSQGHDETATALQDAGSA